VQQRLPVQLVEDRRAGFTTLELVVVIAIVGIVSLVALPRLFEVRGFETLGYYDQTLGMVRFAHKLAIAQRRLVYVEVAGALKVCSTPNATSCSCASPVSPPVGSLAPLPAGVSLAATTGAFCFDSAGRPLATSLAPLATANTVTVTGDRVRSFVIEPETGYVHP
jgi:MSHA pilin protein MshC